MVTKTFSNLFQIALFARIASLPYDTDLICLNLSGVLPPSLEFTSSLYYTSLPSYRTYTLNDINIMARKISRMPCATYFNLFNTNPSARFGLLYSPSRFLEIKYLLSEILKDNRLSNLQILQVFVEDLMFNFETYFANFVRHVRKSMSEGFYNEIQADKLVSESMYFLTEALMVLNKTGVTDIMDPKDLLDYLFQKILNDGIITILKTPKLQEVLIRIFIWLENNIKQDFYIQYDLKIFLKELSSKFENSYLHRKLNARFKKDLVKFCNLFEEFFQNVVSENPQSMYMLFEMFQEFFINLGTYIDLATASGLSFSDLSSINLHSIVFDENDFFEVKKSFSILYNLAYLLYISRYQSHKLNRKSTQKEINQASRNIVFGLYLLPFSYDQVMNNFPTVNFD